MQVVQAVRQGVGETTQLLRVTDGSLGNYPPLLTPELPQSSGVARGPTRFADARTTTRT